MKRFLKYRILPGILSLSIAVSLFVVPTHAVALESAVTGIMTGLGIGGTILDFCKDIGIYWDGDNAEEFGTWWTRTQRIPALIRQGKCTEYSKLTLDLIAHDWNANYASTDSSLPESMKHMIADVAMLDGTNRYYIRVKLQGSEYADKEGLALTYYDGTVITSSEVSPDEELEGSPVWGPRSSLTNKPKKMLSREALQNYATEYGGSMQHYGDFWIVFEPEHGAQILCDSVGLPLAAYYDDDKTAINQDRPSTTIKDENGNEVTIEGDPSDAEINLNDMTINLPDGLFAYIDQLVYDEGTKTYYIDASTHNTTTNITNNYYFKWEYHINYTSITYIGQTEEYDKYYEVYYELPDGRDSADLTKEELEQLNVSIDVIPYGRSADDTSLRSLYHFDGDTKDASYWNYCTDFTWNKGASLTYMDAGVFNGALYLDETEHDFTLTLPSNIGSGDFTLQFRYYQSATAAPVTDSYIQMGGKTVMQFDGSSILYPNGNSAGSVPIGTWNELAFVRSGSQVWWYLNGVALGAGSALASHYYNDLIAFHFGSQQQTFKYIDELRVLNYAIAERGANYDPTSVPHDTNLSLVLPDSAIPIADEYWKITSSGTNLLTSDFMSGSLPDNVQEYTFRYNWCFNQEATPVDVFYYDPAYTDVSSSSGSLIVSSHNSSWSFYDRPQQEWARGLLINLGDSISYALPNAKYTFSVVLSDGSVSSVSFWSHSSSSVSASFDWGEMGLYVGDYQGDDVDYLTVYIDPYTGGSGIEILYVELVKSTSTDLSAEKVTSVTGMTPDQFKTPTLAVRTDIGITSYQIGGVRPSIPTKGQVWALVENERITSIQIYNGQAWEGVDGRIWTGSRWIPASSYNIVTLQDMYDIQDATSDYEYIYTESGFWAWWQKSWNSFTTQLFNALGSGAGSGVSSGNNTFWGKLSESLANGLSALIETLFQLIADVLQTLVGAALDMLTGFFGFLSETVLGGVGDFFGAFSDSSLTDFFQQENEDGTTTVTLPDEVASGMSQITGFFNGLPGELRSVVLYGMALLFLLAAFKLVV